MCNGDVVQAMVCFLIHSYVLLSITRFTTLLCNVINVILQHILYMCILINNLTFISNIINEKFLQLKLYIDIGYSGTLRSNLKNYFLCSLRFFISSPKNVMLKPKRLFISNLFFIKP